MNINLFDHWHKLNFKTYHWSVQSEQLFFIRRGRRSRQPGGRYVDTQIVIDRYFYFAVPPRLVPSFIVLISNVD